MLRRSPRPKGLDTQTDIKSPDATEDESSGSPATGSPPKFWFDMEKKPRVSTRELFNGLRSRFAGKPLAPAPAPSPTGTSTPQRAGRGKTASQPPSQHTAATVRNHPCFFPANSPLPGPLPSPLPPSTCTSGCRPLGLIMNIGSPAPRGPNGRVHLLRRGCDDSTGTDGMPTPRVVCLSSFLLIPSNPSNPSAADPANARVSRQQLSGSPSAAVAPAIPPASH